MGDLQVAIYHLPRVSKWVICKWLSTIFLAFRSGWFASGSLPSSSRFEVDDLQVAIYHLPRASKWIICKWLSTIFLALPLPRDSKWMIYKWLCTTVLYIGVSFILDDLNLMWENAALLWRGTERMVFIEQTSDSILQLNWTLIRIYTDIILDIVHFLTCICQWYDYSPEDRRLSPQISCNPTWYINLSQWKIFIAISCYHKITEELLAVYAVSEHPTLVGQRLSTLKSRNVNTFLILIKKI